MAKFLFVYRDNGAVMAKMTPQEMEQTMQQWTKWIGAAVQKGWMLEPGDALTPEGKVVRPKKLVTDGPFMESKEMVGGYSIVQADDLAAAAELAKGCPALLSQGSVEVRPLAGMGPK